MNEDVPMEFQGWIPDGFQVIKIRRPQKNVPDWANSDNKLRWRIFGEAIRRYRVAYLYWRCNWNAREVAEELGMTKHAVEVVINRLTHGAESVETLYRGNHEAHA